MTTELKIVGPRSEQPWFVVVAKPASDHIAFWHLRKALFEVYAPQYAKMIWRKGAKVCLTPYLFAPYLFVRVCPEWPNVVGADGVRRILLTPDEQPGIVPDKWIETIRGKEVKGLVQLPRRRARGELVQILQGQFEGFFGMYQGVSSRQRDIVSLDKLGSVELAVGDLDLE